MPQTPTYEQLLELVEELSRRNAELERVVAEQAEEIAELWRRLVADSSNSSQPPSGDRPWRKPAKKRSARSRSGRQPGKQPGASSRSRRMVDFGRPIGLFHGVVKAFPTRMTSSCICVAIRPVVRW